ncbi:MAG: SulP family sulfate permease, partial [Pseudohongiellaceae bacterium]
MYANSLRNGVDLRIIFAFLLYTHSGNTMFDLASRAPANAKNDILSGLTVALALVPEAVAFAFVAGVDPLVGLYAAFMVGLITAAIGGRPGMIS